jgi:hypothetical protein
MSMAGRICIKKPGQLEMIGTPHAEHPHRCRG